MERQNEPIKIGRIARSTERALGLSLTGEVAIYIGEKELDDLAVKMPGSYLKFLHEVTEVLKNPDFVSFDTEKEAFTYEKFYFKDGLFSALFLVVGRGKTPGRWYFKHCFRGMKVPLPKNVEGQEFHRPVAKRILTEGEKA